MDFSFFSNDEILEALSVSVYSQKSLFQFKTKIVWFNAIGFLLMHLIGAYGLLLILQQIIQLQFALLSWTAVLVFLSGEGITMGAHRLWTHRSYKAKLPLQLILMMLETIAGQNCIYIWVRDHRQHHQFADTDADPHNIGRGFFFSHIGWLMMKKHPDVIKSGSSVDMSDMEADKVVMFQKKYYKPLYVIFALIIPVGVPMMWGEDLYHAMIVGYFTRYICLLNITWSVNSVAHMFGTKPFNKSMMSVDSFFVAFISLGEGWHNYHHAFPWDYKAGEMGTGYNGTRHFIEFFEKIGWAHGLRIAPKSMVESTAAKKGDGSYAPQTIFNKNELLQIPPLRRLSRHS